MAAASRNLEDILTCCLCFELYDTTVNIPKGLPCLHTFCAPCLDKFAQRAHENRQNPKCPQCNVEFSLPQGGAGKLPTNFSTQDMVELNQLRGISRRVATRVKTNKVEIGKYKTHATCKKHPGKPAIMVCVQCEVGLCTECINSLSKHKHKKHTLEDINTYLHDFKKTIDDLKERSNDLPKLYEQNRKTLDKKLADIYHEEINQIHEQAERAIQDVKRWQQSQKDASFIRYREHVADLDDFGKGHANSDETVNTLISNVEVLSETEIPSIQKARAIINPVEILESRYQQLSARSYDVYPIGSVKVVTSNE